MDHKISIIIPAYNIESYLARTLDSVLAQTYTNIEVIVVNDGSKDGTGRIIDRYAAMDSRVRGIHKENGGVTSARLRGVAEATGEWIGFVDGDDLTDPDMYARLLENALTHNAQISHCGYRMEYPNGRVVHYYNSGRLVVQEGLQGCMDSLEGTFVEPGLWNKLYRRTLLDGIAEKMPADIRINEDYLMNYWLFKAADRAVFEDFCPYHYILRRGSAATSKISAYKLRDPLEVIHIIMEDAEESLIPSLIPRLTRLLVMQATRSLTEQPELVRPYRTAARRELRRSLGKILSCSKCGAKLKIMALWTAIWPASFSIARKAAGIDKEYRID